MEKVIKHGERWDKVLINDYIVGYVYYQYLSETPKDVDIKFQSPLVQSNYQITGLDYNTNTVNNIKSKIITSFDFDIVNNKNELLKDTDLVGTGCKVRLKENGKVFAEYTFILYGDASGDGKVNSIDLLMLQRHILEIQTMEKIYQTAVTLAPNAKKPTSIDLLIIIRHILEIKLIEMNNTTNSEEINMLNNNQIATIDSKITNDLKNNTNLETLAIENELLNPPFDNNVTSYNVEVSNSITNIKMLAIPENENAKVQITGLNELKEGDNQIQVIVTSENGIVRKIYKINVRRRSIEEENVYINQQQMNEQKLINIYTTSPHVIGENYTAEKTSIEIERENTKNISNIVIVVFLISIVAVAVLLNIFRKIK